MSKLESLVTANVPADWTGVSPLTALRTQINQLIALLDNPEQVATAIDTFNEIVDFLAGIDPDGTTLKQFIDLIQAKVQAADSSVQIVYDPQNPTANGTGIKVKIANNGYGGQGLEVVESGTDAQKGLRVKLGTGLGFRQDGSVYAKLDAPLVADSDGNIGLSLAPGLHVDGSNRLQVKSGAGLEVGLEEAINVKAGEGIVVTASGVSVKPKTNGGIVSDSNGVSVAPAGNGTIGGVKLGFTPSGNNKPVQLDANGKAYVDVGDHGVSSVELTGTSPILVEGVTGDSASTPKKNVSLILAQTTDPSTSTRNRSGLEVASDSSSLIGGLRVKTGSGLEIYTDGSVQVVEGAGIAVDNNSVSVAAGNGIAVASNTGVSVKAKTNGGISVSASGVEVQVGDGIKVTSNGVELDASPITTATIDAIIAGTYSNS